MNRADDDRYLAAARAAIDAGPDREPSVAPWLTPVCQECEVRVEGYPFPDHVALHVTHAGYVLIGCEGYWQINPNRLGIESPNWQDWR